MKSALITLSFLIALFYNSSAKAGYIDVEKFIKESSSIRLAKITGYKDSTIFFTYTDSKDTVRNFCQSRMYWDRFQMKNKRFRDCISPIWPNIGDHVLIILNPQHRLSIMFAKNIGDKYHCWLTNPNVFDGQILVVPDKAPFSRKIPVDNKQHTVIYDGGFEVDTVYLKEHH